MRNADRLKKIMDDQGWSVRETAELLGVSRKTVYSWLTPANGRDASDPIVRLAELLAEREGGETGVVGGDMKIVKGIDLTSDLPSDAAIAAALAEAAARIAREVEAGRQPLYRLESVSWRLADALEHVRHAVVGTDAEGTLPGVDEPTGMGARLTTRGDKG